MKHPSVSDALTETTPHADPDFQYQLEQELIAKMQTTSHDYLNGHHSAYPTPHTARPTLRLPFTLAAAMMLVILVGSILFVRGKQSPSNLGVMVAGNSTPTVSNTEILLVTTTPVPSSMPLMATATEFMNEVTLTTPVMMPSQISNTGNSLNTVIPPLTVTALFSQATQSAQEANDSSAEEICRAVVFSKSGIGLRAAPNLSASIMAEFESGTEVNIVAGSQSDNWLGEWLFVEAVQADGTVIEGWIGSDVIAQITSCPLNTVNPENLVAPDGKVLIPMVVAVQNIPRGTKITEDMLTVVYWPVESVPENIFTELTALIDTVPRAQISQYQPIFESYIVPADEAALGLPPDMIAVNVPMSQLNDVAYGVQPGDRVDVLTTLMFVPMDDNSYNIIKPVFPPLVTSVPSVQQYGVTPPPAGTTFAPQGDRKPSLVRQRIVQGAIVIEVSPADKENKVVLGVNPVEAVTLVWAIEAGFPLTFVLVEQ